MNKRKEIVISLVSLLVLASFIWAFYFLKGKNILMPQNHYYAVYDRVDGLGKSRPLTLNGLKIGQVDNIYLSQQNTNKIIVDFIVTESLLIPSNSVARIYSQDIMGTKSLELQLGDDTVYANPGDTLISDIQATLQEEVNQQVLPLKLKAEELLSSLDTLMMYVNAVLDKETRDNLSESFADIQQTFNTISNTVEVLDLMVEKNSPKIDTLLSNVSSISTTMKNNSNNLDNAITNFSNFSDSLSSVNIVSTITSITSSVSKLDTVLGKVNDGEGTLSKLLNDKELYDNFEEASKEVAELLEDMKRNPNRYVHFSVFGRNKSYKKPKDDLTNNED